MAGKSGHPYSEPWIDALVSAAAPSEEVSRAYDRFRLFMAETPALLEQFPAWTLVGGTDYPRLARENGDIAILGWGTNECAIEYNASDYRTVVLGSLLHSPTVLVRARLLNTNDADSVVIHLHPLSAMLMALANKGLTGLESRMLQGMRYSHALRILESWAPPDDYYIKPRKRAILLRVDNLENQARITIPPGV